MEAGSELSWVASSIEPVRSGLQPRRERKGRAQEQNASYNFVTAEEAYTRRSEQNACNKNPSDEPIPLRLYLYNKLGYRINTQRSTGTDHALPISIDAADKPAALPAVSCRMQEACSRCCESAATTAVAAAGAREVSKSANKPPGREGLLGLGLRSCGLDRRDVRRTEARRALVNLDR